MVLEEEFSCIVVLEECTEDMFDPMGLNGGLDFTEHVEIILVVIITHICPLGIVSVLPGDAFNEAQSLQK